MNQTEYLQSIDYFRRKMMEIGLEDIIPFNEIRSESSHIKLNELLCEHLQNLKIYLKLRDVNTVNTTIDEINNIIGENISTAIILDESIPGASREKSMSDMPNLKDLIDKIEYFTYEIKQDLEPSPPEPDASPKLGF